MVIHSTTLGNSRPFDFSGSAFVRVNPQPDSYLYSAFWKLSRTGDGRITIVKVKEV
jgi:hypothetical protein